MRCFSRIVLAATLALAAGVGAQTPSDARVKAKLAFNMARFTEWPAGAFSSATEPLSMCLLHRSEALAAAFGELQGQMLAGHPIRLQLNPTKDLGSCHLLFVQDVAERASAGLLAKLGTPPVLTIGDGDGFATRGGMIELVNVNDTMRFDVNLSTLRTAQLLLSSQVLKLARQVRE